MFTNSDQNLPTAVQRPTSITIIGRFLIGSAILVIIYTPIALTSDTLIQNSLAMGFSYASIIFSSVMGPVMPLVCGIAILKGRQWGRQLYLFALPVIWLITLAIDSFAALKFSFSFSLGLIFYAAICVLLTRPRATAFFTGIPLPQSADAPPPRQPSGPLTGKQIGGIVFLVIGGFVLFAFCITISFIPGGMDAIPGISVFFVIPLLLFLGPGIYLFGPRRWKFSLGVVFASVGGMLLMVAGSIFQSKDQIIARSAAQPRPVDPRLYDSLIQGSLILGVIIAALGALLIYRQLAQDKKPAGTE